MLETERQGYRSTVVRRVKGSRRHTRMMLAALQPVAAPHHHPGRARRARCHARVAPQCSATQPQGSPATPVLSSRRQAVLSAAAAALAVVGARPALAAELGAQGSAAPTFELPATSGGSLSVRTTFSNNCCILMFGNK